MVIPFEDIVKDAVTAPSGENCQPWRFVIKEENLFVYNVPEADYSLYNFAQRGSYIANGSLLENISHSAKARGYHADIVLFPFNSDETCIARVIFTSIEKEETLYYKNLLKRCTNRKDYFSTPITQSEKVALITAQDDVESSCVFIEDSKDRKRLGEALSLHEEILFENKRMHDFFYHHLLWKKEDESKSGGFFIDTLEFSSKERFAVKMLQSWSFVKILNRVIGVSRKIAKDNAFRYYSSPALVLFSMNSKTSKDYVQLGMRLQRFWLTATSLDLSVHPCNGTLYLYQHIQEVEHSILSKRHAKLITEAHTVIEELAKNCKGTISFIMRIGHAESPTSTAKRLAPKIEYL